MSGSGVVVAILKEQHPDHIVLSDGSRMALAVGLIIAPFLSGDRITIGYTRDSRGEMVAQSIESDASRRIITDRAQGG